MTTKADPLSDGISEVELIQYAGSDARIAAAARVSYLNDQTDFSGEKDAKLIRYMLTHGHGSPFEHNLITFRVKAPLFVVQEMLRHRIGVSFNQQSGRYTEFTPEFYVPKTFRQQDAKNKQASSGALSELAQDEAHIWYRDSCIESYRTYTDLLELGVPREQARGVLPHCTYTSLYITFNVRSLLHFLDLRTDQGAQWEIQQYAHEFARHLASLFPATYAAWNAINSPKE